tara:strand:+ start:19 stop:360 length:342 start_codon:yes stop_codon:yes gene_type:complete
MIKATRISTKTELLHCVRDLNSKSLKTYCTNVIIDPTEENAVINAASLESVQNLNGGKPITTIRLEKDQLLMNKDHLLVNYLLGNYPKDARYRKRNGAVAMDRRIETRLSITK